MNEFLEQLIQAEVSIKSDESPELWREHIQNADHKRALILLEATLVDSPHDLRTRLWWVHCQLAIGGLPLSALSAPLEEILPELEKDKASARLSCGVFLQLGLGLLERLQSRLAAVMMERALHFSNTYGIATDLDSEELNSIYKKTLELELKRAQDKLDNKSYIAEIQEKLAKLKVSEPVLTKLTGSVEKKRKIFNSKSILQQDTSVRTKAIDDEVENESVKEDETDAESSFEDWEIEGESGFEPIRSTRGRKWPKGRILALGISVLLVVFTLSMTYVNSRNSSQVISSSILHTEPILVSSLEIPEMHSLEPISYANSQLGRVQERLSRLAKRPKDKRTSKTTGDDPVSELLNSPDVDGDAVRVSLVAQNTGAVIDEHGKEELDNDDAIAVIGSSSSRAKAKAIAANTPLLNPEYLSKAKTEDLGMSHGAKGEHSPGRYMRGPDGRLYGPAINAKNASTTLDGSPLRAYKVEKFSSPLSYKTITETNVLEAPSSLAPTLATLNANSKVQVVSSMGHWYEIRSTGGRRGYIYAQDVVSERK